MAEQTALFSLRDFKGLNNRLDPLYLSPDWQTEATGVLLDNSRFFVNQMVESELATGYVDLYGTRDGRALAIDASGNLYDLDSFGIRVRASDVVGGPFTWTELGTAIFCMSATHAWAIYPDRVVPWGVPDAAPPSISILNGNLFPGTYRFTCVLEHTDGRVGGGLSVTATVTSGQGLVALLTEPPVGYQTRLYVSAADGDALRLLGTYSGSLAVPIPGPGPTAYTTVLLDELVCFPPPRGYLIGRFGNRLVVAQREVDRDETTLYFSRPDYPHLFDLLNEFVTVPGTVNVLADFDGGCVVGTDQALYRYGLDRSITKLAEYGSIFGSLAYDRNGMTYFWSERGLCRAEPFQNLTEAHVIFAPSGETSATVFHWRGSDYYLCSTSNSLESVYGYRTFDQAAK
ncbi:MAG: hypothetical protein IPP10_15420 [Candidatus Competibacteraceae bacterium]|nr:hypothetical protein [Candidatus Competibacteraceae bacterium]